MSDTKKFRMNFYVPARDGHYVDDGIGIHTFVCNALSLAADWNPKEYWHNVQILKTLYSSHVEIHTPDERGLFNTIAMPVNECLIALGDSYTSTMGQAGGKNRTGSGVCVRPASEVYTNPERWFYCEFEVPTEVYDQMVINMGLDVQFNKGYDKKMIWSFFGWRSTNDKDKYICSEFCFKHLRCAMFALLVDTDMIQSKRVRACAIETQLKPTMSPLRGAHTLHKCGVDFYNMDKSLLLAGIK